MSAERRCGAGTRCRTAAVAGVRDSVPVVLGTIPYGLVMGVAAASAGFSPAQAAGLSALVFAGISQLTAVDLFSQGTAAVVVVVTALVINVRFTMYSASIAPHLEHLGAVWRLLCPFFLIGPVYAIALNAFQQGRPAHHGWYLLGLGLPSWVVWVVGTLVGMVAGARVPAEWQLGFVVPLVFIAIVVRFVEDGATLAAALVSGGLAVAVAGLPLNLGLLVATVVGIAAGTGAEWRRS